MNSYLQLFPLFSGTVAVLVYGLCYLCVEVSYFVWEGGFGYINAWLCGLLGVIQFLWLKSDLGADERVVRVTVCTVVRSGDEETV